MSCSFDPKQIRVALLAGGKSGERSISLASGEGAKEALLEAGFPVTVFDPANKEDLLALIQGDFDVAFLALHGKYGEDGTRDFWKPLGFPILVQAFGRAPLLSTNPRRSFAMSAPASLPLVL